MTSILSGVLAASSALLQTGLPYKAANFLFNQAAQINRAIGSSDIAAKIVGLVGEIVPDGWANKLTQLPGVIGEAINFVQATVEPIIKQVSGIADESSGSHFLSLVTAGASVNSVASVVSDVWWYGGADPAIAGGGVQVNTAQHKQATGAGTSVLPLVNTSGVNAQNGNVIYTIPLALKDKTAGLARVRLDYGSYNMNGKDGAYLSLSGVDPISSSGVLSGRADVFTVASYPVSYFHQNTRYENLGIATAKVSVGLNNVGDVIVVVFWNIMWNSLQTTQAIHSQGTWNILLPQVKSLAVLTTSTDLITAAGTNVSGNSAMHGNKVLNEEVGNLVLVSKDKKPVTNHLIEEAMSVVKEFVKHPAREFVSVLGSIFAATDDVKIQNADDAYSHNGGSTLLSLPDAASLASFADS